MSKGNAVGRPRDDVATERVLAVVREMLAEVGWDGLSVRAVATRAGVGRATVTRRWPSKAALVLHAVLGETPDMTPFHRLDDRRGWLEWVLAGSREIFARSEVRAALPGLLMALDADPALRRHLWATFSAPPAALLEPEVDAIDGRALIALAAGAALFVEAVAADDDTEAIHGRIRDLLMRAFDV
jgi:AcrR family transcriptional regulator